MDNEGEMDIPISGPDEGEGGVGSDEGVRRPTEILAFRNVYRVDFEDHETREYMAKDIMKAVRLARLSKPGAECVQVSRVCKNVVAVVGMSAGEELNANNS